MTGRRGGRTFDRHEARSDRHRWKAPHRLLVVLMVLAAAMASSLAFQSADASASSVDVYRNSAAISLPGNGNASTYPSTINVPLRPSAGPLWW